MNLKRILVAALLMCAALSVYWAPAWAEISTSGGTYNDLVTALGNSDYDEI